ncbi:AAA family ATPase [Streptomyces albus subsp. chlorinus]|nr:AAA family ATPase [Streptomyces albus]NSC24686.1 AAA family ATPase [Streptomyces albus subsp. chlorinus]
MPGAGKSTVAPLVAAHHARAAHISGDVLSYMVVRGRAGPVSGGEESRRQLRLCFRNMCALANNFADSGIFPVLEHPVGTREVLDLLVTELRPRPVLFVTLAPPLEVCRSRNAARPAGQRVAYDVAPYYQEMRRELEGVGWWLDSSQLDPEQTAALIAAEAPARAALPVP